jgi:hypothetical protein
MANVQKTLKVGGQEDSEWKLSLSSLSAKLHVHDAVLLLFISFHDLEKIYAEVIVKAGGGFICLQHPHHHDKSPMTGHSGQELAELARTTLPA